MTEAQRVEETANMVRIYVLHVDQKVLQVSLLDEA